MQAAIYKVNMTFLAAKDVYGEGETGDYGAEWQFSEEFSNLNGVKDFVKSHTYSGYEYIEYDSCLKCYLTAYMATDENMGEMSKSESEQWKRGEINGWYTTVNIQVQKFTPKIIGNIKFN